MDQRGSPPFRCALGPCAASRRKFSGQIHQGTFRNAGPRRSGGRCALIDETSDALHWSVASSVALCLAAGGGPAGGGGTLCCCRRAGSFRFNNLWGGEGGPRPAGAAGVRGGAAFRKRDAPTNQKPPVKNEAMIR